MKNNPKDSRQIINLVNKLEFKPIQIGNYSYLSDVIKVPIFIFNQDTNNEKEILTSNKLFIETFCNSLSDRFISLSHDLDIIIHNLMNGEVTKYMEIVNSLLDKNGKYANQHKLASELTHYTSSFMLSLRVGLICSTDNVEESLTPDCVIGVSFETRNKFDKKLNKQLEMFIEKLTVFTKDNDD